MTKVLITLYAVGSLGTMGYLCNSVNEVKADRENLTSELQKAIKERESSQEQNKELTDTNTILEKSNAEMQATVDKTNKELDKLKKQVSGLKGDLDKKQKQNEELQTQVALKKEKARKAEEAEAVQVAQPVQESAPQGRTLVMESTAYSSDPADALGGGTVTATGQNLLSNPIAVAVDPNVIPLGTKLHVEGYGTAYAVDTGGAIKGNIIDVHFPTASQCNSWGRRQVTVTILS